MTLEQLMAERNRIDRLIDKALIDLLKDEMVGIINKNPDSLIILSRTPTGFTVSLVGKFSQPDNLQGRLERRGIHNVIFDLCTNVSQVEGETIFRLRGKDCLL